MATEAQIIANRRNAQKSISTQSLSMSLGTPADCFMQNKANLWEAQMKINKVLTKGYENKWLCGPRENKPNSKPIYAQTNPISIPICAKQSQSCPPPADSKAKKSVKLVVQSVKSYEPEPVNAFFALSSFVSLLSGSAFFTRRPLRRKLRGRGVKNAAGFYFRLAAHTPIRAHHKNDGTQNCLRQKGPILSDVISANGGLTLHRPGSFL